MAPAPHTGLPRSVRGVVYYGAMKFVDWLIIIICALVLALIVASTGGTGDYNSCVEYPENPEMGHWC